MDSQRRVIEQARDLARNAENLVQWVSQYPPGSSGEFFSRAERFREIAAQATEAAGGATEAAGGASEAELRQALDQLERWAYGKLAHIPPKEGDPEYVLRAAITELVALRAVAAGTAAAGPGGGGAG